MSMIDNLLNRITMYRLMLYFLIVLILITAIFCFAGILPYDPLDFLQTVAILVFASWLANKILSTIFRVPTNFESDYITAFILSLIITPGSSLFFLVSVAAIAQASKYILAYRGRHLFNPAAIAVLITFYALNEGASWWIGDPYILPIVIAGGFLVMRKVQRFDLVLSFLTVVLVTLFFNNPVDGGLVLEKALINSSLLFFSLVMLTEPLTTPPNRNLRIVYGAIVGWLYGTNFMIGGIISSPELALVLGNLFSFIVSSKGRFRMKLKSKSEIAANVYNFIFEPNRKVRFVPGQYMEWTVTADKSDSRGNRRYFTIASSPTENDIFLGVKFYENSSTFKNKLQALNPGEQLLAGQQAGDFTLPSDQQKKLAFIAGGIGITPFRSMIKYLIDTNEKRDIVLFYSVKNEKNIAYREIFSAAEEKLGSKIIYIETDKTATLNADVVKHHVPDFMERSFYISGPRAMVTAFEKFLRGMGVTHIKVDFFPGYV